MDFNFDHYTLEGDSAKIGAVLSFYDSTKATICRETLL